MAITAFAAVAICISSIVAALIVWRRGRDDNNSRLSGICGAIRFVSGPFPLSVALHIALFLFLVITIHESRGRDLTILTMDAGGGGGSADEMRDLELQQEIMPDVSPISNVTPNPFAENIGAIRAATDYVRSGGGIGIVPGSGVGSDPGHGIGPGFGGFLMNLRRNGLDVVLVIDGTGSMKLVLDDVKARMRELVRAIHNLVPTARIGIVVYGGAGEAVSMQPLTQVPSKLETFLAGLEAKGGGEWEENVLGGVRAATDKMDWRPYAKKVIVLVADSPPAKTDFAELRTLAARFRRNNGTFNAIDVSALEHQRFEAAFDQHVHREAASEKKVTPLPTFFRETQLAYQVLVHDGGGEMHALTNDEQINQQVMVLAFGEKWRAMISSFSRNIAQAGKM